MADYGSLQAHSDAVLALLRDQEDLVVFPAPSGGTETVPHGTLPPYVAVHFAAARPEGGQLGNRSTGMLVRIYVHCVGANDVAARAVSDLVAKALLDARPTIPGRNCRPIKWESGQPPRPDESTGVLVSTLSEVYRLDTRPGPP